MAPYFNSLFYIFSTIILDGCCNIERDFNPICYLPFDGDGVCDRNFTGDHRSSNSDFIDAVSGPKIVDGKSEIKKE